MRFKKILVGAYSHWSSFMKPYCVDSPALAERESPDKRPKTAVQADRGGHTEDGNNPDGWQWGRWEISLLLSTQKIHFLLLLRLLFDKVRPQMSEQCKCSLTNWHNWVNVQQKHWACISSYRFNLFISEMLSEPLGSFALLPVFTLKWFTRSTSSTAVERRGEERC